VRAANLLHDTIRDRLSRRGREYENCKIMVRAYTNLAGLSKTLARAGLVGHEARSLSPFCSNFTRAQDLFDFVDAGDKKENADNKIREMFRLFVENNQCKHIFFAGCHDTGYLNLLTPYIGKNDKITLVRGSSFSPEFSRLGLDIDNLNGLFHSNPLEGFDARRPIAKDPPAQPRSMNTSNGYAGFVPNNTPICTHYLRGMCKFGNGCKKSHNSGGDSWRSSEHMSGQETAHTNSARSTFFATSPGSNSPALSNVDSGSFASGLRLATRQGVAAEIHPSLALPVEKNGNLIPVNSTGHRLDILLPAPSAEDWKAYSARIAQQGKLCNEYQLKGSQRASSSSSNTWFTAIHAVARETVVAKIAIRDIYVSATNATPQNAMVLVGSTTPCMSLTLSFPIGYPPSRILEDISLTFPLTPLERITIRRETCRRARPVKRLSMRAISVYRSLTQMIWISRPNRTP
jgi:hypothetical protein